MADRKHLIAIVEDDPSLRKALVRLLRVAGFDVRAFESAEDFLRSTEADCFVCMLLDIALPGMSGFDLYCSGVHVPTVFISADESNWARAKALNISHEMFLCKPFSDFTLLGAVNAALNRQPNSST